MSRIRKTHDGVRGSLVWVTFVSIVAVALGSILTTGLIARAALSSAFTDYVGGLDGAAVGPGRGIARMMLGTAERTFLNATDQGIMISALVGIAIAAVAAILLARFLARPVLRLTAGAEALAAGDLEHRVTPEGPGELQNLAAAFNEMAGSLQESEELRKRLVSDVAHELRNPIAALRAQAEGVAEGVLPLDQARLASIVDDVAHLSHLVDDLQELSVAEAGRLRYDFTTLDVCELVQRETDRARTLVDENIEMMAQCPTGALLAKADEMRLAQVLRNLLANAARHTASGSIIVTVAARGDRIHVTVVDTGEGIPEADLPYVFERFYRSDAARAAGTGGSGLGLAISKRIISDHGGSVFAERDKRGGATVGFELPRADI
ncbi:MAG: ATP-binding protein [Coriobacteriia bacterium]|nr:ATP-binding protein [Coriobacteriia bacterium]